MALRPVEVGAVDRPDHPSLRDSGCSEKARGAAVYGLLGGAAFGAVFGATVAYRCKYRGVEVLKAIYRGSLTHGMILFGAGWTAFALQCY